MEVSVSAPKENTKATVPRGPITINIDQGGPAQLLAGPQGQGGHATVDVDSPSGDSPPQSIHTSFVQQSCRN